MYQVSAYDFNIIREVQEQITKSAFNAEENLLKQIMSQTLNRPATINDAHMFSYVYFDQHPGRTFFGYDNKMIGEIVFSYKYENGKASIVIEFVPKTFVD